MSLLKFDDSEFEQVLTNEVWLVARPERYECESDDSEFTQVWRQWVWTSLTTVSLLKFDDSEFEQVLTNEVWLVARPER